MIPVFVRQLQESFIKLLGSREFGLFGGTSTHHTTSACHLQIISGVQQLGQQMSGMGSGYSQTNIQEHISSTFQGNLNPWEIYASFQGMQSPQIVCTFPSHHRSLYYLRQSLDFEKVVYFSPEVNLVNRQEITCFLGQYLPYLSLCSLVDRSKSGCQCKVLWFGYVVGEWQDLTFERFW